MKQNQPIKLQKRLLTIREAAGYLNVSTYFLYKLTADKKIPFLRMGRKILFDLNRINAFISNNSIEPVDWVEKFRDLR